MAALLEKRANTAIQDNYDHFVNFAGGPAANALTTHGSDWYWAVFAILFISTAGFIGLSFTKPREHRIFHYITAAITMVATIAYFSMASNIGWAPIAVEFQRGGKVAGANRQIFYVRYIDWVITTPLLLMDLLLTAGLPWPTVFFTILIDEVMIITGLVGALVRSSYKWGYFVFGMFALFWVIWVLAFEARLHAGHIGADVGRVFLICGTLTSVLWFLYPIAWGLAEGGNVISSDSEAIFYGILDVLAKPVFGALLLWGHRNIDPARLGLSFKDYRSDDTVSGEKTGIHAVEPATTTTGPTNGSAPVTQTV